MAATAAAPSSSSPSSSSSTTMEARVAAAAAEVADGSVGLAERFRALFVLAGAGPAGSAAFAAARRGVEAVLLDGDHGRTGALLRHEAAYVLGQMGDAAALPVLEQVLRDDGRDGDDADDGAKQQNNNKKGQDVMVRHEAAEAMGAIGDPRAVPVLKEFLADPAVEVRETCEIALALLEWDAEAASKGAPGRRRGRAAAQTKKEGGEGGEAQGEGGEGGEGEEFDSVDPAPPGAWGDDIATPVLRAKLLNTKKTLFRRYQAMFALRNRGGEEAVRALCDGLDDDSALFRHEIAYVLGQMQHPASTAALAKTLEKPEEAPMVRHEAAEALGAVGTPEAMKILDTYKADTQRVVAESCVVGLDIADYFAKPADDKPTQDQTQTQEQ